jgi:hypothetical protein
MEYFDFIYHIFSLSACYKRFLRGQESGSNDDICRPETGSLDGFETLDPAGIEIVDLHVDKLSKWARARAEDAKLGVFVIIPGRTRVGGDVG